MAKTQKKPNFALSPSSSPSILEISAKTHHYFFILSLILIFIFTVLIYSTCNFSKPPLKMAKTVHFPSRRYRALFSDSVARAQPVNFRSHRKIGGLKSRFLGKGFNGDKHEVPSGPNPISNR
ncbi:hypothetical protein CASFOL_035433 [Castilleja foliolosa]|uniref:Uncharacterized protein n=1 Tax=Castilleja foliolosa TaxID=1961234 RepID=A0ABD3BTT7_9LAMI